MKNIAVLTGDIIGSRKVADTEGLIASLKQVFSTIKKETYLKFDKEIFRGDSFQIVLYNSKDALLLALLIRIGLRSKTVIDSKSSSIPLHKLWDARIAIGIGKGKVKSKIIESNGEAFQLSGLEFDKLKKAHEKLNVLTVWEEKNEYFNIIVKLLDVIISKWTKLTSEVVFKYLLKDSTQSELAKSLKVSQPAIHKRLSIANIDVIEKSIQYISQQIASKNN